VKVTLVHNHYRQPGGEDQVFAAEGDLLEAHGHSVTRYAAHNDTLDGTRQLALARATVWNGEQYRDLRAVFREARPDVVHVHNTLPLVSPAVYYAARAEGAAVVQTLHNFRVACVNGLFFRDGHVCEDCLGKLAPWRGVLHACYRGSRAASAAVAAMVGYHKLRGTYREQVDAYITLTDFSREKFVAAGLPARKLFVKPNFVYPDPGVGGGHGGYALFVGRLSDEKGAGTLLAAWQRVGARLPLLIVGDGPMAAPVAEAAVGGHVTWLGRRPPRDVYELMGAAAVVVIPSEWFETFGRVAVEAFATGTPVLASNIGAIAELVDHRRTGLLFTPGDAEALVDAVAWAISHPAELAAMRRAARAEYEDKYTAEANYDQLMATYQHALEGRR